MLKLVHPVEAGDPKKLAAAMEAGKPVGIYAIGYAPGAPPRFTLTAVSGGYKVAQPTGAHIGSYADIGAALAAGALAVGGTFEL